MPIIKENPKKSESESENERENESENESESESESENEMGSDMCGELDLPSLLNHFFTNEEGQNIAEILTDLKKSVDTHNKLIYKLVSVKTDKK